MDKMWKQLGFYAFVIGSLVAVLLGFAPNFSTTYAWLPILMVVLGLVAGVLAISRSESTGFLVAIVALAVVGATSLAILPMGNIWVNIVKNLTAFWGGLAIPVGIMQIYKFGTK